MMKIEQNRIYHLSDWSVNHVNGREFAMVLILQQDRQFDLACDKNLIDVRRHQSLLMTLRSGTHDLRRCDGDIGRLFRLPRRISRCMGR